MNRYVATTIVALIILSLLLSSCNMVGQAGRAAIDATAEQGSVNEPALRTQSPSEEHYIYGAGLEAHYKDGELIYTHQDYLGSSRATTNTEGNPEEDTDYLTYGEALSESQERYTFTGKESDGELQYFGARYYDPDTGRFTQKDPISSGRNWYTYANNNPLAFVDPAGMAPANPEDEGYPGWNTDITGDTAQAFASAGFDPSVQQAMPSGEDLTLGQRLTAAGILITSPITMAGSLPGLAGGLSVRGAVGAVCYGGAYGAAYEYAGSDDPNWEDTGQAALRGEIMGAAFYFGGLGISSVLTKASGPTQIANYAQAVDEATINSLASRIRSAGGTYHYGADELIALHKQGRILQANLADYGLSGVGGTVQLDRYGRTVIIMNSNFMGTTVKATDTMASNVWHELVHINQISETGVFYSTFSHEFLAYGEQARISTMMPGYRGRWDVSSIHAMYGDAATFFQIQQENYGWTTMPRNFAQ